MKPATPILLLIASMLLISNICEGETDDRRAAPEAAAQVAARLIEAVERGRPALGADATLKIRQQSVKCEVGSIGGVSIARLANCNSAVLIGVPAYPDIKLIRFMIRPTDAQISAGTRAELQEIYEAVNGEETWYRFSSALPEDFPFDAAKRFVLAQWHEHAPEGGDSYRPPLAHRLDNSDFVVTLWNAALYAKHGGEDDGRVLFREPNYERGVLHEYVYRIVWAQDARGAVTGWRRVRCRLAAPHCAASAWQKFIDYKGPVGYPDVVGYYFKMGLYTTHKLLKPVVAYDLDYERGPTAQSIGAVEDVFK